MVHTISHRPFLNLSRTPFVGKGCRLLVINGVQAGFERPPAARRNAAKIGRFQVFELSSPVEKRRI